MHALVPSRREALSSRPRSRRRRPRAHGIVRDEGADEDDLLRAVDLADPHHVVHAHEHRRRLPRRRRQGQRARQPRHHDLRERRPPPRSAQGLRSLRAAGVPREERRPVPGRGPELRRSEGHHHHGHQARGRLHPRPDGDRVPDAAPLDPGGGDGEQHRRASGDARSSPLQHVHPGARGVRPDEGPARPRLRDLQGPCEPGAGAGRLEQDVRGGQLPRHRRERALPHLRRQPRAGALELPRGGGVPRTDARAERAAAEVARARPGRRVPRGRRHLHLAQRGRLRRARELGARARAARRAEPRSRLHLLRAQGAARAGEEGLHDDSVPLGLDVPRLPPARRRRRELRSRRPGGTTSCRSCSSRSRATTRTRAASSGRTSIAPRSAR